MTKAKVPGIDCRLDDAARRLALEERRVAARREKLLVRPDPPPFLRVEAPSGFSYRIHLRGGAGGPHSCDCPDFEANRLHTCKHVECVCAWLESARSRLPLGHQLDSDHREQQYRSISNTWIGMVNSQIGIVNT